jgi:hypothetical protein
MYETKYFSSVFKIFKLVQLRLRKKNRDTCRKKDNSNAKHWNYPFFKMGCNLGRRVPEKGNPGVRS